MKATEIRDLSVDEMNEKLVSLKEELFSLRFSMLSISWITQHV